MTNHYERGVRHREQIEASVQIHGGKMSLKLTAGNRIGFEWTHPRSRFKGNSAIKDSPERQ
jgi:hypothetical protein